MDSPKRTWTKAIFWQLLGLVSMVAVGYLFTGSLKVGGLMALVNAALGLATYVIYERFWARVSWGRRDVSQG